jgi:hypothetical protein
MQYVDVQAGICVAAATAPPMLLNLPIGRVPGCFRDGEGGTKITV